jgi:hypothetical protein
MRYVIWTTWNFCPVIILVDMDGSLLDYELRDKG